MAAAGLAALSAPAAWAQSPPAPSPGSPQHQTPAAAPADGTTVEDVVVTARRLDEARQAIQPGLGATTYTVTNATIQALPGGDNQQLNQVILQLPGVVQDGFGQLHVRDDHNGLQYRLNGVILPEGLSVFGQTLSPRLIDHVDLITGAMPAQYGLRTAGVIDVTSKSGLFNNGGQVSIYGGSHGLYEPSLEYGGSSNGANYFVSADFKRNQLGIENVNGSYGATHDRTDQGQVFGYVDKTLSANDRVSLLGGYTNDRFQIPNPTGLQPDGTYTLAGSNGAFPSEDLNETQRETTGFVQGSFLHDAGKWTVQTSLFARYSTLTYRPDVTGELLYNGLAQAAQKKDAAFGSQTEAVYRLDDNHTIRGGLVIQGERATSKTQTAVFPADAAGNQTSATPIVIADRGGRTQFTYSLYLQDEWRLLPDLTLNYGLRADEVNGYRDEGQISPRVNAVWTPLQGTTIHAGYARYFTPPPFELVGAQSVARFQNTTGASPGTQDTTPYAERQNYYDVGAQQRVRQVPGLTLGVDAYYRESRNLIDEGQFGAPIILTPFNYREGLIRGVEFSVNYAHGPWQAYANFAVAKAQGKDIVSSQFSFDPADLAYIQNHFIYLDHDQTYTGSAGATYDFKDGPLKGLQVGGDLIYGSGLRKAGDVPNGAALGDYTQVNLSASRTFDVALAGPVQVKFDVINVGDTRYEIRDGSGVGVGAPQYGPRRGYFLGLTRSF
jgi:hypothetical protein